MIVNDLGEYESMSEEEYIETNQATTTHSAQDDSKEIFCDGDSKEPSFVVTRTLTTNVQVEEDQRCNLFQKRAGINGKLMRVGPDFHVFVRRKR